MLLPLFATYHVGILFRPRAANGADLFTRLVAWLLGRSLSLYLLVLAVLVICWYAYLKSRPGRRALKAAGWPLGLVESLFYALIMGPVAGLVLRKLHLIGTGAAAGDLLSALVLSSGAGFYEELVFRLLLLTGINIFVKKISRPGISRWLSLPLALVVSSVLFSLAHHVGPGAERITSTAFVFRTVLGLFLGVIFLFRGIDRAAWSHFFYDVIVVVS